MTVTLRSRWPVITLAFVILLSGPTAVSPQERDTRGPEGERVSTEDEATLKRLAESRFIIGDMKGALDALNEIDAPRVGTVKVEGLVRSNRTLVNDYLGLQPGELFTAEKLVRIERRLDELPVASSGKVRFDPEGKVATVTPIVFERAPFPTAPMDWLPAGVRAAFLKEVRIDISDVAGWGEMWQPAYRWDRNRPRVLLRFNVPAPGKLPGVFRLETFWDRQAYEVPSLGSEPVRQSRVRAGAALSDWVASWLRLEGAVAVDRIDVTNYVELGGNLNTRALGNRLAVILTGGRWFSTGQDSSFADGELVVTVRSTSQPDVPVLTALAGLAASSQTAPLALWPGASAGQGRGVQLRARQLLRDGIVTGEVFGRQLLFMTMEYVHPIQTTIGPVGLAAFVDSAQARSRLDPTRSSRLHVDVGVGVRMNTSRSGNAVRLDVGYGLRDGGKRVSAGYVMPWGQR